MVILKNSSIRFDRRNNLSRCNTHNQHNNETINGHDENSWNEARCVRANIYDQVSTSSFKEPSTNPRSKSSTQKWPQLIVVQSLGSRCRPRAPVREQSRCRYMPATLLWTFEPALLVPIRLHRPTHHETLACNPRFIREHEGWNRKCCERSRWNQDSWR